MTRLSADDKTEIMSFLEKEEEALLSPSQTAQILGCSQWALRRNPLGLSVVMTEGGHRRFKVAEVLALARKFKNWSAATKEFYGII